MSTITTVATTIAAATTTEATTEVDVLQEMQEIDAAIEAEAEQLEAPLPSVSSVSDELVDALMAEIESEAAVERRQQETNMAALLRGKNLYLVGMSIKVGVSQAKLEWDGLNLPSELVDALGAGAVSAPTIKIFPELREHANKLRSLWSRKGVKHLLFAEPYWFCSEEKLPEVLEIITQLQQMAEAGRAELLENYKESFKDYICRLGDILLASKLPNEARVEILRRYAGKFPTKEKISENYLTVAVETIRVPSLEEQAASNAAIAQSLASEMEAEAKIRLNQMWISNIHKSLAEASANAAEEIKSLICEQFDRIEAVGTGKASKKQIEVMQENLKRLETLVAFDSSFEEILSQVKGVVADVGRQHNQEETFAAKLQAIKSQFGRLDEVPAASSQKGIAQFML